MAWTGDIDTMIADGLPIDRAYTVEMRNGYQTDVADPWTEIPVIRDGWSISIKEGNPVISTARISIGGKLSEVGEDYELMDEFDHDNAAQLASEVRLQLAVTDRIGGGTETEYLFRGLSWTWQTIGMRKIFKVYDPLIKMQYCVAPIEEVAEMDGPNTDVVLDQAANWDPAGEIYTFELDRIAGNNWGFVDEVFATGKRRAWVPGLFIVERLEAGPIWVEVLAEEYYVDTALGLIRFSNDQAAYIGGAGQYRLQEVSVYIEGTLELAWLIELILQLDSDCVPTGELGCDFTDAQLRTALTGTFSFTNGGKNVVGAAGTAFLTELSAGDRIAHNATDTDYGIVESVTNDNLAVLKYNYRGGTAGPLAGYKSTLRAADLSISNIKYTSCDGTCADLYRKLQQYYADIRGYKIWYDHENDQVRGDRVAIDPTNAVTLAPKLADGLKTTATLQDFATAIEVIGVIGRAKNLISQPGVTITTLAETVGGWSNGPSTGGAPQTWYGLLYEAHSGAPAPPPPYDAQDAVADLALDVGYACYHDYADAATRETAWLAYHQFLKIDLGAAYDLSKIALYRINSRPARKGEKMGVSIYGSLDDVVYNPLSPDTMGYEMGHDEVKRWDIEGIASARYIRIDCRPLYWVDSGKELTMGFREIAILGSQQICTAACVQDTWPPGVNNLAGTITFDVGGPPWTVTGVGTNFAVDLVVGDYIALRRAGFPGDKSRWAKVASIGGALALTIEDRYPKPGLNGIYCSDNFAEGVGGHFIGGTGDPDDFIVDYHPDLILKFTNMGHMSKLDDEGLVYTEMQALDRAYIMLNECIRLYRDISLTAGFDPRLKIFQTGLTVDEFRTAASGDDNLYFLIQSIDMTDKTTTAAGTEYGAGALD